MLPLSPTGEKKAGLAYWAARVLEECDKASIALAADPVHDLRVAIRRCRSMADGFMSVDPDPAWKQMKRLAKPLFSSLGELRDTQVMLEWVAKLSPAADPVGNALAAALLSRENELKIAAQKAMATFDRKRWAALNAHLAKRTSSVPVEGLVFQHLALERWMEARELHRRALRNRSGAAWHQLRIGIKRFRYTVENFLPQRHEKWAKDLRTLQDALGEVHDFDVLRALIQRQHGLDAAERARWQARIAEERQQRLHLYRSRMVGPHSLWPVWRTELPGGAGLEAAAMEKLRCWASFLDPDRAHSTLVARLALELYDGLLQCRIMRTGPEYRRILEAAAFLHEVGRGGKSAHRQSRRHQKRGERLVCKLKPPLGWRMEEMTFVASLVRYHRGPLPSAGDSSFVGLDRKTRNDLVRMIGVLRLANALDGSHQGRVKKVSVARVEGGAVIFVRGLQPMSRDAECVARARYLLETSCRLPIAIRALRETSTEKKRATQSQTRVAQASKN